MLCEQLQRTWGFPFWEEKKSLQTAKQPYSPPAAVEMRRQNCPTLQSLGLRVRKRGGGMEFPRDLWIKIVATVKYFKMPKGRGFQHNSSNTNNILRINPNNFKTITKKRPFIYLISWLLKRKLCSLAPSICSENTHRSGGLPLWSEKRTFSGPSPVPLPTF